MTTPIKPVKSVFYCFFVILVLASGASLAAQRELASEGDDVVLSIDQNYQCQNEATIIIDTKSVGYFDAGADVIQNLADVARAILGFECSGIKKIFFKGYTDSVEVFSADAGEDVDWALQSEPSPLERYALFFSLRDPTFFNLGAFYELKKPFEGLNGIEDSFQFEAYQKQLTRLSEFIDGDVDAFLAYLESPVKGLGSFNSAKSHFEALLSAIETQKPELYVQYITAYLNNLQSLKDKYWSSQTAEVLDDYSLSISEILEKAKIKIKEAQSTEFTEYFDIQIAEVLNEEIAVLREELVDASLLEVSFAADFLAGLPEEIEKDLLPGSAALLGFLPQQVAELLDKRREELFSLAQETIEVSGDSYLDTDAIMETGFALSQEFEDAGFLDDGELLIGFTIEHINKVLSESSGVFKAELDALELDDVSATALLEQTLLYEELAAQFSGYTELATLIEDKLVKDRSSICESILVKADVEADKFETGIELYDKTKQLTDIACELFENDHTLVAFVDSQNNGNRNLEIVQSDDVEVKFELAITSTEDVLAAISMTINGETKTDEDVVKDELYKLIEPPPNGKPDSNGIRECDRFAGDPMDASKLSVGLNFEVKDLDPDDFDRALDACIASVEDNPNDARQQFQLGRMLWFAGDLEDAGYYFNLASAQGYSAALHYQAELLLSTSEEQNDFVDALAMFKTAGEGGYQPSIDMIKELNPDGINFYKEIPPPSEQELVDAMPNVSGSRTILGTTSTVRLVGVDIRGCFQTSATDFSCEFKKILRCSISSSFANSFVTNIFSNAARADCNAIPYEFGDFRKVGNGRWRQI